MSKIKTKIRTLVSGEFSHILKGVMSILLGTGTARIIGFASIPVLTRIYTPEEYGVLALYISLVTALSQIMTFRYVQAIPLPKKDAMAFNLLYASLKLILFNSIIIFILFLFFKDNILKLFSLELLNYQWWLIIIGASLLALYECLTLWATRKRNYRTISYSSLSEAIIGNLAKIGLGLLFLRPEGLIFGFISGQVSGILTFASGFFKTLRFNFSKISSKQQIFILKYYKEFFLFRFPSQLLMIMSIQAPIIMAANLYNKEITGQLSLAIMVLSVPAGLIGKAIARVFYGEIASLGKNNLSKIKEMTHFLQKRLLMFSLPVALIAMLLIEPLFILVFGEQWSLAGRYAVMLSPFMLFQFTSAPLMEVINILGSQVNFLILHSIRVFGLIVIFFLVKVLELNSDIFVIVLSTYLSMFYLSASLLVLYILSKNEVV
ncbi:oligosaccharide flippase family protein [Vibrio alginolyticus]|uniref:lipopolysaccharide biosynthesis protein n=1 Tax=Vibrio TaxID=662 RepID=UPI00146DC80F|nr:oligosaccharide flippase family protein [Vibrio sp. 1167]MDW2301106.1 oligosaccharide flippase family protein [Vibrio sp. 1167]NMT95778.1 oligosaccharide flippase family protein [Vibrio alginolyticus]